MTQLRRLILNKEILSDALKTGATIQLTKKSGASITGTVRSIANNHFVFKCRFGLTAMFFNTVTNIEVVNEQT